MSNTLGDAPVQPEYVKMMTGIARVIDEAFNGKVPKEEKEIGFILMVFPFDGHEGRCNYMSNANRQDVVVMLKEQLARFEGMPEAKGRA